MITGIILDKERNEYMSYRLNKRGKILAYVLLFIVSYVVTSRAIDCFLQEQEQIQIKSKQLQEQLENSKN